MSRYFTSPPPVYARNWANGQNLVDSTKIERLQVVSSKKVQRKEKKEKKKDKKQKSSLKLKCVHSKQVYDETEQLEKSCVTEEEVEQQQCVGYLSDGSQNSKKRRRKESSPSFESPIKVAATPVAGKPLRIRFVFKKPKEVEVVVPEEERVCSTSGSDRPVEVSNTVSLAKTSDQVENLLSTSYESDKTIIPSESKKIKKHKPSKETRYNTLFDEWVPSSILSLAGLKEDESNNDDWLFGSSRQGKPTTTKLPIENDQDISMSLQRSGESCFPRAQLLSEVGIFSLPYTVPF